MPKKAAILEKQSLFTELLGQLNAGQRQAVDTIEGPVMVVAGPGTGKTQVVAMRVANILRRTQMRPGNILCVTYSVSGATAMRERLRSLIGADAYGVTVSTIHAFAQSIINDHPQVFEDWSVREQLSDIDRYRELNAIIDTVSSRSDLINPKDPYGKDTDLLGRISQVKREGKTLADLEAAAAAFDEQMRTKSKPTTKAHQDNLLKARKFRDFIEIFRLYQEMLDRTGRYDYDDMILHVLRALAQEDWLLASLQERYQYILVDEFQDLNGAQYELLTLLTAPRGDNDPNIFIVGDDDQAIYRFQGANVQQMLAFHERFPQAPVIPLTVSYRSTQNILDAARSLIERNEERLVGKIPNLEKVLTAASGEKGEKPALLRVASDLAEPWVIADLIEERLAAGTPMEEIAVLTRKNQELFPLYDVLRSRNLPVLLRGKSDLLSHPYVAQILAILRCIEQPASDARLSAALAATCLRMHPADLARLQAAARERKTKLLDILLMAEDPALKLGDVACVVSARDKLLSLQQRVGIRTVVETVEAIIRECTLLPCAPDIAVESIDPRDSAAVEAFFSFVKGRCIAEPTYSFRDFLSDLHFYSDPEYGQVRLTYELPHLTQNGIRLMTAHQSKGLEFDVVILANFKDKHWDDPQQRSSVSVPEELLYGWESERKTRERHEDERRLAFVAATRARKELLMVCPKEVTVGEKVRTISPSAFFAEMGALPEKDTPLKDPAGSSLLLRPVPPQMDGAMTAYLKERLETFALSPTSLERFLKDPREFLHVDLLQQPEYLDEGALRRLGYGSAAHWALREWATATQKGKEFSLEQFLEAFEWYLKERTILTERQRGDLAVMGQHVLTMYFKECLSQSRPIFHAIEREYRAALPILNDPTERGIPIKGKIDRIDLASRTSGDAIVIDYKSGAPKTDGKIRGGLEPGVVSRNSDGANFRQLVFYALLLEKADPLLQPQQFAIEFIGERGEKCIRRAFSVTDAEKDDLRSLIRQVWAKITALDFTPLEPGSRGE